MRTGAFGDPGFLLGYRRAGGDVAEILLDLGFGRLRVDVAGDGDHGVGGAVVGLEPLMDVFERGGVEVFHRADSRPGVGVSFRVGVFGQQLARHAVGLVFALAFFILHHPALLVDLLLGDGPEQVPHPIRLHPERDVEGVGGHVLEIVGAVGVGRAVEVGSADAFERLEVVVVEILRAVEHQVFEEVGKAGLARLFIFRPDVIPHIDGHDGGLVVFVHDEGEAVVEDEFFVGDVRKGRRHGVGFLSRSQQGNAQQQAKDDRSHSIPHYAENVDTGFNVAF